MSKDPHVLTPMQAVRARLKGRVYETIAARSKIGVAAVRSVFEGRNPLTKHVFVVARALGLKVEVKFVSKSRTRRKKAR